MIDTDKKPPPGRKPYQIITVNVSTGEERIFAGLASAAQFLGVSKRNLGNIVRPSYKYRKIVKGNDNKLYAVRQGEKMNVEDGTICQGGLSEREAKEFIQKYNKFAERVCLHCNMKFESNGPWQRRCVSCENSLNTSNIFIGLREHKISAPGTARKRMQ